MIDAPWYGGPVEKMAFNLFAFETQKLEDAANDIAEWALIYGDVDLATQNKLCAEHGFDLDDLSDNEFEYIQKAVDRRLL